MVCHEWRTLVRLEICTDTCCPTPKLCLSLCCGLAVAHRLGRPTLGSPMPFRLPLFFHSSSDNSHGTAETVLLSLRLSMHILRHHSPAKMKIPSRTMHFPTPQTLLLLHLASRHHPPLCLALIKPFSSPPNARTMPSVPYRTLV